MTLHPRLPPTKGHHPVAARPQDLCSVAQPLLCSLSSTTSLSSLLCHPGQQVLLHLASPHKRSLKEVEWGLLPLPGMLRERQMELEGARKGGLWAGRSSFWRKRYSIEYRLMLILTTCSFSSPLPHSSHTHAHIYIVSLVGH